MTNNYIKMCEQAEEIQKEWGCHKGDWVKYKNEIIVLKQNILSIEILKKDYEIDIIKFNQVNDLVFDDKKNQFIWLPIQGQLWEIIIPVLKEKFKDLWDMKRINIWMIQHFINFMHDVNYFDSLNEFLFAFVMKEKYHKTWTDKTWVKS